MTTPPLARLVQRHKAIAHPVRLRVLAMLRGGPLCVCQMTAVTRLAASTVSEHLSELRRAGLVAERKEGRWVEYRLATEAEALRVLDPVWPALEDDRDVQADAMLLKELRRVPVADLCDVALDLKRLGRPKLLAAVTRAQGLREPERADR